MEKHIVKVLSTTFVTHNVKRFTLERPEGYQFTSGQATDVSINKPGMEDDLHPFTFTSLNTDEHLEFTIKTYPERNGMTQKLLDINAGDEFIVHEVFGAITYRGPGIFIAGGAGITPFIAILRQLYKDGKLVARSGQLLAVGCDARALFGPNPARSQACGDARPGYCRSIEPADRRAHPLPRPPV